MRDQEICWKQKQGQPNVEKRSDTKGSWYAYLLLFCGVFLCVLSTYLELRTVIHCIRRLKLPKYTWIYVAATAVALSVMYEYLKGRKLRARVLTLPALGAPFLWYYLSHRLPLEDGILYFGRGYAAALSEYFERIVMFPIGDQVQAPGAMLFLLLCILCMMMSVACICQHVKLLLLLPVSALAAGIVVDRVPDPSGMMLFAISLLMLCMYETSVLERPRVRILQTIGVLCSCILSCAVLMPLADSIVQSHETMLERQQVLEDIVLALPIGDCFDVNGRITNEAPHTTGKTVLTMTLSDVPTENIYLKDYSSQDYENGTWQERKGMFSEAASQQGLDVFEAGQMIYNFASEECLEDLTLSDKQEWLDDIEYAAPKKYDYTLELERGGRAAPVPYLGRLPEGLQMKEDMSANKPWFKKSYSGSLMMAGNKDHELLNDLGTYYLMNIWQPTSGDDADGIVAPTEELTKIEWYDAYVKSWDTNGQMSEQEIEWLNERFVEMFMGRVQAIRQTSEDSSEQKSVMWSNLFRVYYTIFLQQMMQGYGSYSQNLTALPAGEDPIEYFLFTSQKGFCIHYASAGVLMLQELGIPARYASGYVIFPGDVEKTNGKYTATITDKNAHAWAEIYLDEFGWVPVEMTPGFVSSDRGTAVKGNQTDSQASEHTIPKPQGASEASETKEEGEDRDLKAGSSSESSLFVRQLHQITILGIPVIWWLSILFLAAAGVLVPKLIRKLHDQHEKKQTELIEEIMNRGQYRSAIRVIDRRMYRMVVRRERLIGRRIRSDRDYRRGLGRLSAARHSAVDMDRYMELIKQAHFSEDSMCAEDVEMVYDSYRRCRLRRTEREMIANGYK